MARGRMLNTTISEDIEFNELSLEAQLIYLRTIPFLDRDGLINGHPSILMGKIAPLLSSLKERAKEIIDELVDSGLVLRYMDGKTVVLWFKGFTQNQIGLRYDREPASQFAAPPGFNRTKSGLRATDETLREPLPEDCRNNAGCLPEGIPPKRREDKIIKEKTREQNALPEVDRDGAESSSGGGDVFSFWQEEIKGEITPAIRTDIKGMVTRYGESEVREAIRLAAIANSRTPRYVGGILKKRAIDKAVPVPVATSSLAGINLGAI